MSFGCHLGTHRFGPDICCVRCVPESVSRQRARELLVR